MRSVEQGRGAGFFSFAILPRPLSRIFHGRSASQLLRIIDEILFSSHNTTILFEKNIAYRDGVAVSVDVIIKIIITRGKYVFDIDTGRPAL